MKIISMIAVPLLAMLASGCGYSKPMTAAPQPGVVPVIAELSPGDANAGGPGLTLTVNGGSFASGAIVNFNGARQATTYITAKQLAAIIPASALATAGTMPVTVTNPATPGAGGIYGASGGTNAQTSSPMNFVVN